MHGYNGDNTLRVSYYYGTHLKAIKIPTEHCKSTVAAVNRRTNEAANTQPCAASVFILLLFVPLFLRYCNAYTGRKLSAAASLRWFFFFYRYLNEANTHTTRTDARVRVCRRGAGRRRQRSRAPSALLYPAKSLRRFGAILFFTFFFLSFHFCFYIISFFFFSVSRYYYCQWTVGRRPSTTRATSTGNGSPAADAPPSGRGPPRPSSSA